VRLLIALCRVWVLARAWRAPPGLRRTYVIHTDGTVAVILDFPGRADKAWLDVPRGMPLHRAIRLLHLRAAELADPGARPGEL
jgi:RecB family endonuclease NucS